MDLHIILDVDGTLVVDTDDDSKIPEFRPYLREFLHFLFETFATVSIWSNASAEWINPIVEKIKSTMDLPRDFLFVRTRTTFYMAINAQHKIKYLKNIYRQHKSLNTHNTLILDDTPATYRNNYGNAIGIDTWRGSPDDKQLLTTMENIKKWIPEFNEKQTVRHTHKYSKPFYPKRDFFMFFKVHLMVL